MTTPRRVRFPLMGVGMLTLLLALWAGLLRLGWTLPSPRPALAGVHGPLMVAGFLGTLISLERAVALDRAWMYGVPALHGVGALALVIGGAGGPAALLLTAGSVGLMAIFAVIVRRHPALHTYVMAAATVAFFIGNVVWLLGQPVARAVPWWAAFLVLTIAGERLELGRLLRLSSAVQAAFLGGTVLFAAGVALSLLAFDVGVRVAGLGMLALALWHLRFDIARRTVHQTGLPRFTALCLLTGYVWLGLGGILALLWGGVTGGLGYDAIWHAVFLGFVFSMIFGHAPIIFPAVLNVAVPYTARFYVHFGLLHASLLMRVVGDLLGLYAWYRWGGLLNALAVLLFLVNTVIQVRRGRHAPAPLGG